MIWPSLIKIKRSNIIKISVLPQWKKKYDNILGQFNMDKTQARFGLHTWVGVWCWRLSSRILPFPSMFQLECRKSSNQVLMWVRQGITLKVRWSSPLQLQLSFSDLRIFLSFQHFQFSSQRSLKGLTLWQAFLLCPWWVCFPALSSTLRKTKSLPYSPR